jgi:hypothetical protein
MHEALKAELEALSKMLLGLMRGTEEKAAVSAGK